MTPDLECPLCGHNARRYTKPHCTSPTCQWLKCTNKDCNTVYDREQPETYNYAD